MKTKILLWVIAIIFFSLGLTMLVVINNGNSSSGAYAATFQMFGSGLAVLWALYLFSDK